MPRGHASSSAVAIVALAYVLLVSAAPPLEAQGGDIEALWKEKFKRPPLPIPSPPDNPLTPDKVALGAKLFADARLSGNGKRSCASCHEPLRQFTDGRRRALALSGPPLRRNTP